MIGQWNQAWAFGDCCCNFGELSGTIVSPTKMGYNDQALESGLGIWIFLPQFW